MKPINGLRAFVGGTFIVHFYFQAYLMSILGDTNWFGAATWVLDLFAFAAHTVCTLICFFSKDLEREINGKNNS